MMGTQIRSKRIRAVCRTRPVSKLLTEIRFSFECVLSTFNASIDCPPLAGTPSSGVPDIHLNSMAHRPLA